MPDFVGGDKSGYMFVVTIYIMVGMTVFTTIIEIVRRQYAESWRKMQELRAQIQAQLKLADTLKKLGEQAGRAETSQGSSLSVLRASLSSLKVDSNIYHDKTERNNLALDLDIGTDLAELKANLAKFKKGKHGKGLEDIDIEQLDWVSISNIKMKIKI